MHTRKEGIIPKIMKRPKAFSAHFVLMFLLTYGFLFAVDMTPEVKNASAEAATHPAVVEEVVAPLPELPARIEARSVEVNAFVSNPESTNVQVLDAALTKGAVRYPTSAKLGEEGTVLLFGHSSHLPIVYNKAYQAFNEIGNLKEGETVSVYSASAEYRYKVVSISVADANEDVIELPQSGRHLILVTCDTFSKKSTRFVVKADFVGTYALASR